MVDVTEVDDLAVVSVRGERVVDVEFGSSRVDDGVTVGANAVIVCGTHLAHHAFVGAGSVVTRDVPAYALVVGNPARRIGWMSAGGERLNFDAEGRAVCPVGGELYLLAEGIVLLAE